MLGSVVNELQGNTEQSAPQVGDGATILMWSDRHAATIVEVPSPKTVIVQQDDAKRIDGNGISESQEYEYTRNTSAPYQTFTQRKNGTWVRKHSPMRGGIKLRIGKRDEYYDFTM